MSGSDTPPTASRYLALLSELRSRGVDITSRSIVPQVESHECFGFTLWCVDVSGREPIHLGRVLGPHDGFFKTQDELRAALHADIAASPAATSGG
ncbi:hypothetical protein [Rhodoplanes roseus]|uniref:Uncharacterized protein n=1 Tax=Rhodoplanes roseus TaxID=29409 RepID=A0A327KX98_9BRAD|nr:hypothetical protein [Rhodoplanes roseus]RAI42921.1 hypothetical protein CH341_16945 [Rhodoplanes roseus]